MVKREMAFCEIAPFVRYAADVYITASTKQIGVTAYDHRLFYVVNGNATVDIGGTQIEAAPGTVLYWMSGNGYRICPVGDEDLHLLAVDFDFTLENVDTVQYLPMVQCAEYNEAQKLEDILFTDAPVMNAPVCIHILPELLPYLQAMVRETSAPKNHGNFQLCNLMRVVLVYLCREASQRQQAKSATHSFRAILEHIQTHYTEELDNKQLAKRFNYHPNYLNQLMTEQTGTSLHQYLIGLRIRQALYLLQTTELPINEIARQVGYRDPSYFSHYFKQCTGHSPRKFRV